MKTAQRKPAPAAEGPTPASLTYYIVVLIAGLSGLVAYSSGASLEGVLARMSVVVLACTILGYAANVIFWLSGREGRPKPAVAGQAAQRSGIGTRVNLVTGDDGEVAGGGSGSQPRRASAR